MLAAHMDLENVEHQRAVQTFWDSPRIASRAGLKAVEMFDAIHDGRIKAVWIMATNPVVSLPDANRAREALQQCDFVVVSDCVARTDTLDLAHVKLPAAAWGEKDGTVTNSERRISRQRAFVSAPADARPDWWIICEVAKRMGFGDAFSYASARDIFVEHAKLSGIGNHGTRAFDISPLAGLTAEQYDCLVPFQWGGARINGRFYHRDGKARFVGTPPRAPANAPNEDFPFVLNTGRIRDQWHTMTRTGRAPTLSDHLPEPFVDMHAQDALLAGIRDGALARLTTQWGSMAARLRTSGEIARGNVFVPIHWNATNASDARVGALVNPVVDPTSGEPEFKHTPARIEPLRVDWYGVLLTREPLIAEPDTTWWTQIRGDGFYRYELAGRDTSATKRQPRHVWARRLLNATDATADFLDYEDNASGVYRAAFLIDNRLVACICIAPSPQLPSRTWLANLFAEHQNDDADRRGLLAGKPQHAIADTGALVCSCFRVGTVTITEAIARHSLKTPAAVGERLRAGTNCGSCLPEIRRLLASPAITNS